MKFALAFSLALCLALGATTLYLALEDGRGFRDASGSSTGAELSTKLGGDLNERLGTIERRLSAVSDLELRLEALRQDKTTAAPALAIAPGDPEENQEPKDEVENEALVDELLGREGASDTLKDFIAKIYYEERDRRAQKKKEDALAKQREQEELAQGPYGEYNYSVNKLTKSLELTPRQTDYVYRMHLAFAERRSVLAEALAEDLKSGFDSKSATPEAMQERFRRIKESSDDFGKQFETEFANSLTPSQKEAFEELPSHERHGRQSSFMSEVYRSAAAGVAAVRTAGGK